MNMTKLSVKENRRRIKRFLWRPPSSRYVDNFQYEENLWTEITKYLDVKSLVKLASTCRWFNQVIMEEKHVSVLDGMKPYKELVLVLEVSKLVLLVNDLRAARNKGQFQAKSDMIF